jgi:ribosome recycling factor
MIDFPDIERRMGKAIESLGTEFSLFNVGRANPAILDAVQIDAYGTMTPLAQLGTVNVPEPRLITIQVWDKSQVPLIEKAIIKAALGINPVVDGQLIRLPIPQLSEERRKEVAKQASRAAEQARIAVRNIRRDGMDSIKAEQKEIGKDEAEREQKQVQTLTDKHIKIIDQMLGEKEKDVMQI